MPTTETGKVSTRIHNREVQAKLVRDILERAGVSPREAADRTGIHRAMIYQMRQGDRVGEGTMRRFAAGLGAEDRLPELLASVGRYDADPLATVSFALTQANISEAGRQSVLKVIKELLEEERQRAEERCGVR